MPQELEQEIPQEKYYRAVEIPWDELPARLGILPAGVPQERLRVVRHVDKEGLTFHVIEYPYVLNAKGAKLGDPRLHGHGDEVDVEWPTAVTVKVAQVTQEGRVGEILDKPSRLAPRLVPDGALGDEWEDERNKGIFKGMIPWTEPETE